jgi:hypothetical protein
MFVPIWLESNSDFRFSGESLGVFRTFRQAFVSLIKKSMNKERFTKSLYIENSGLDISMTDDEFISFLYEKYISKKNEDIFEKNEDFFDQLERLRNMLEDTGDDLIYEEWDFRIDFHQIE